MHDIHDELTSWFTRPCDLEWPDQLAKIIRCCEGDLSPVWHPLGFIHTKLSQGKQGDTFRMHLWSSQHRDAQEQEDKIHDHLFHARSRVVYGCIRNVTYQFTPHGSGTHREVRVNYSNGHSSLQDCKTYGNLEMATTDILQAPVEYVIRRFELHETSILSSDLALTVVHTTEHAAYSPRAIFRRDASIPPLRTPIPCEKAMWRNLLQKTLPI